MGVTAEGRQYMPYDESQRMALKFRLKDNRLGIDEEIPFLIDTGATSVVLPAEDLCLNDEQANVLIDHSIIKQHTGLISNVQVQYYRYNISEFGLGKIKLVDFPIHVTFDRNAQYRLLGMSFLKLFNIFIQPGQRVITFSALPFTEKIVTGQSPASGIERVMIPQIGLEAQEF